MERNENMGLANRKITTGNRALEFFVVVSVIVVVSAISFVFMGNILAETRDSKRVGDIASLRRALELYHLDHVSYPVVGWVNSGDDSWNLFVHEMEGYISEVPSDPINDSEEGKVEVTGAFNYSYGGPHAVGENNYVFIFRLERPKKTAFYQSVEMEVATHDGIFNPEDRTDVGGVFVINAP